jgi:hypothetical protein
VPPPPPPLHFSSLWIFMRRCVVRLIFGVHPPSPHNPIVRLFGCSCSSLRKIDISRHNGTSLEPGLRFVSMKFGVPVLELNSWGESVVGQKLASCDCTSIWLVCCFFLLLSWLRRIGEIDEIRLTLEFRRSPTGARRISVPRLRSLESS